MRKYIMILVVATMMAGCGSKEVKTPAQPLLEEGKGESLISDGASVSSPSQGEIAEGSSTMRTMGKVVAAQYADLSFETALPIERVLVKNGQHVRRGQVLAQLDQFKLRNAIELQQQSIEQAQLQIEQAHLQMEDVIISQGYDPDKTATVPENVMHNADVKSGFAYAKSQLSTARTQLAAAQHELRSGVLTAPFDGVVANVAMQAHQLAQPGQTVCRIIGDGNMTVDFRVMEADLCKYKIGTAVSVIPVADKSQHYAATVCEINPIVDEQGAITLRARLDAESNLFDGMNVEIILKLR